TIETKELREQLQAGEFISSVFELVAGDKTQRVLPRDVQFHPVTDWPLHVDFLRVEEDTVVPILVRCVWTGEDTSPGLTRGGVLNVVRHEIELLCPAGAIPETIECSVADLDIGDGLHISDVQLPKGVSPRITDRDFTIVTIAAPSGHTPEAEGAEEGEGEGETEGSA
ncbi:MAG: 50S ribosomal protein L25/general stress protein Ctc, partial [Sphingomonadales bacterium]